MQNESPAVGPEDSTDTLGAGLGNSISLTQEQANNAGITNPQVGDQYTVTIKVDDNSDGISATILDGSAEMSATPGADDDEDSNGEEGDDGAPVDGDKPADMAVIAATPVKKKKTRVMSPKDMGISMESGL